MPRDGNAGPSSPVPRRVDRSHEKSGAGWAAIIGGAVLIVTPITAGQEGYIPKAVPDPAGIPTGCYGERVDQSNLDPARIYSKSECMDRLRKRLAAQYAPPLLACMPELADRDRRNVFAALIDAAWNAGPAAVCRSPMAARVHAGQWTAACNAFVGWRVTSRGVTYRGLVRRRRDVERPLCLRPVPPPPVPLTPAGLQLCAPLRPAPPPMPIVRRHGVPLNPNTSNLS